MNKRILDSISFFKEKPVLFLIAILPLLKLIKIDANQEIYYKGDIAHEGIIHFKLNCRKLNGTFRINFYFFK
jgi:hypothetical protein